MSPSVLPAPPPADPEADRLRAARLANLRQELLAPVAALVGFTEMLAKDAAELDHAELHRTLGGVHDAAVGLERLVRECLATDCLDGDRSLLEKRLRHDLRSPLNPVIGYCELLLEDAGELVLARFEPDLRKVLALAREILNRLDDILAYVRDPQSVEGAAVACALQLPPVGDPCRGRQAERGRVLIVDDNEHNRDLLARRLARDGHAVATACNGRQALDLVRRSPFDLVLLDVLMPEVNGFQVLDALKADEVLCHVPVLMVSALDEIDSVVHCIARGAEDYLTRPVNPVLLRARVNACLEKKRLRDREVEYRRQIERERQRADDLLHVILPAEIVSELKAKNAVQPRRHEHVAVLFADLVGFTPYCDRHPPEQVVTQLQRLVEHWEEVALAHGVEKIKTIGDAFMAACGLLRPVENPVLRCLEFAVEMSGAVKALVPEWDVRVGIHAGPVVAGVVGRRQYLYDLWGDTVNTAARMESHGRAGAVTLSGTAWEHVRDRCRGESLGQIPIKGKGPMEVMRFIEFVR